MPKSSPENQTDENAPETPVRKLSAHAEFALRGAKPLPLPVDKKTIDEALAAGVRQELDPQNPENQLLLDAGKLSQLAQAFQALAAGEVITAESRVTAVEYDAGAKQLKAVSNPADEPLPPIPLLEAVANQATLEGVDRDASYDNVRLAFALSSSALTVLGQEQEHLSDKALSVIQASLQKIRELTIHYPLASQAEGLSKGQLAGLLNAINMTITSDPVKAIFWRDRNPLQRALDRL